MMLGLSDSDILLVEPMKGVVQVLALFPKTSYLLSYSRSALQGSWASVVLRSGAAAIAVERCHDAGKMADKEVIVGELAAREADIVAKHYGAALLSRYSPVSFLG
jgi:hypothetical protein